MSPQAYKTFASSPGILRGFCSECGGSLTWYDTKNADFEVLLGSVDDIRGAELEITEAVRFFQWGGVDGSFGVRTKSRTGRLDRVGSRNGCKVEEGDCSKLHH